MISFAVDQPFPGLGARSGARVALAEHAHRGQSAPVIDWSVDKRAAAHRLLGASDQAVVEDVTTLMVLERSVESMSFVCEVLTALEAGQDFAGQETILWVLSPAWRSGEVDVASLLHDVRVRGSERARRGATIAIEWLHIDA